MDAKQRQLKKLASAPQRRNRHNFNSVLLTSEVFRFVQSVDGEMVIELGSEKHPLGCMPFKAHRPYGLPKMIVIRETGGQWFVSFCYDHASDIILREPRELAWELNQLDDHELARVTLGIDRNVRANYIATSDGRQSDPKLWCVSGYAARNWVRSAISVASLARRRVRQTAAS